MDLPTTTGVEEDANYEVITDFSDSRVAHYFNLKDHEFAGRDGLFIAEGVEVLRLLLRSELSVVSLLLKKSVYERMRDAIEARTPPPRVYIASNKMFERVVGFPCRGSLGCGEIPVGRTVEWLRSTVLRDDMPNWRVLAVDTSFDVSNIGSLVRSASAFGIHAVILSSTCCDVWYRKAVRVSMGHVFTMPVVRVDDLAATLTMLHDSAGLVSYSAVIDEDAEKLRDIHATSARWCAVMGNEENGISDPVREASQHLVRVDMKPGVDSLSISVAAGIVLNGLREREGDSVQW